MSLEDAWIAPADEAFLMHSDCLWTMGSGPFMEDASKCTTVRRKQTQHEQLVRRVLYTEWFIPEFEWIDSSRLR